MRKTTLRFVTGAGYGVGPFALQGRARHPRRDAEGHKKDDAGKTDPPEDDKKEPPAGETPEQKAVREAQEEVAKTKSVSEWLVAEAKHQAETARKAGLTEEQRAAEAQFQSAVAEAVETARVEMAQGFTEQISTLRGEIIDGLIEGQLLAAGREVKDFATIVETLDKSKFVDDDGAVKKDEVIKWASELAGAGNHRPPRGTGTRTSTDNGFGRYLPEKNN